mmetsp:Transcript_4109/g.4660  ORF Transcript_4109/g.4660 Transcript_4109/m.4660 type:complete len:220 (+) Transcript_4109:254-913(+)
MAVRRTRADSNRDILGMSLQDSREVEECGDQRDQRCGSAPGRGGNRQRRPPYVYGSKRKGEGSSSSLRSTSPMREERGRPRVSSRHYDEGEEGIGQRRMGGEHARRGGRAGQSEDVARGAGKRRGREEQSQREEGEGVLQRFGRETQEEKEEKEEAKLVQRNISLFNGSRLFHRSPYGDLVPIQGVAFHDSNANPEKVGAMIISSDGREIFAVTDNAQS